MLALTTNFKPLPLGMFSKSSIRLKKLFLSSTKKECFVVRKNAEISEGKQVKMGGGATCLTSGANMQWGNTSKNC